MRAAGTLLILAIVLAATTPLEAQTAGRSVTGGRRYRLSAAGGIVWSGSYPVGDRAAEIRRNASGSTPPPFTLFRSDSTFEPAVGVEGRIGFAVTPTFTVEGAMSWSEPRISVVITEDAEGANTSFDGETASSYVFEGSALWRVPVFRSESPIRLFVMGGAGYLRQLHEERTLVETGQIYHLGGGVQYLLRGNDGRSRPLGVRGDVRAYIRRGGIEFEDQVRTYPAVAALFFVGL
jgi:hypothetical protein